MFIATSHFPFESFVVTPRRSFGGKRAQKGHWASNGRFGGSGIWQVFHTLRIHGTGIFTYIWVIFMVNGGKYTSPMDPMGYESYISWVWPVSGRVSANGNTLLLTSLYIYTSSCYSLEWLKKLANFSSTGRIIHITHRIHVWCIFLHLP